MISVAIYLNRLCQEIPRVARVSIHIRGEVVCLSVFPSRSLEFRVDAVSIPGIQTPSKYLKYMESYYSSIQVWRSRYISGIRDPSTRIGTSILPCDLDLYSYELSYSQRSTPGVEQSIPDQDP